MYRSCIFCSADLGSNASLEAFPVGRSLAFDGEKGRLWAVCPRCARWNLAPLEERWETVEDAERLFRDTRTRVQNENIGLARLPDGTRLVRVGAAVAGELAAWRYGGQIVSRRWRYFVGVGAAAVAVGGIIVAGAALTGMGGAMVQTAYSLVRGARQAAGDRRGPCTRPERAIRCATCRCACWESTSGRRACARTRAVRGWSFTSPQPSWAGQAPAGCRT